jgi:hypothetical protein
MPQPIAGLSTSAEFARSLHCRNATFVTPGMPQALQRGKEGPPADTFRRCPNVVARKQQPPGALTQYEKSRPHRRGHQPMLALVKEQRPERDRRDTCGECATRDRCIMGSLPQAGAGIGPARRERPFQQGEAVTREGELSRHLRIVKVGWVFLCRTRLDGSARPVAIAGRGAMLGSFSYMRQPNPVSAVTGSSVRACEFGTEQIQSLASNDPGFRQRLEKVFCDNVGLVRGDRLSHGHGPGRCQRATARRATAQHFRGHSFAHRAGQSAGHDA